MAAYTEEQWEELRAEKDKWEKIEDDKAYITPFEGVKIPILSDNAEFGDYNKACQAG